MPSPLASRPVALLLAGLTAACGTTVRPHAPPDPGPQPPLPVVDPDGSPHPTSDPRRSDARTQYVCRSAQLSTAWVILDYVESPECPGMGGERYNGAVVVRHSAYPRDSELVVCADQRVPRGWDRVSSGDDPDHPSLCRSTRNPRPLSERVMRIRRRV